MVEDNIKEPEFKINALAMSEDVTPIEVMDSRLIKTKSRVGPYEHYLSVRWETKDCFSTSSVVGREVTILPRPPTGYEYFLREDGKKKCVKCGKKSEFYSIAPYMSKYDGEPICYKCIDK